MSSNPFFKNKIYDFYILLEAQTMINPFLIVDTIDLYMRNFFLGRLLVQSQNIVEKYPSLSCWSCRIHLDEHNYPNTFAFILDTLFQLCS